MNMKEKIFRNFNTNLTLKLKCGRDDSTRDPHIVQFILAFNGRN